MIAFYKKIGSDIKKGTLIPIKSAKVSPNLYEFKEAISFEKDDKLIMKTIDGEREFDLSQAPKRKSITVTKGRIIL